MLKHIRILAGLVFLLALTTGAGLAQDIERSTWLASYWNNTNLSGEPVLRREEASVDYNWGADAPASGVNPDDFSARWQRYLAVEPGVYRFFATSDDGIRVWIDGELIIDQWYDHSVLTVTADKTLDASRHVVVVDYYDSGGDAIAQLAWEPVGGDDGGWRGEYFNNRYLEGTPRLVRTDSTINFNWGTDSPAPGLIDPNTFSVRWSRTLDLPPGLYRFIMTVDDGGRLWVNDSLLIDAWEVQSPTSYTGEINHWGGPLSVRMEYFDQRLGAIAQLERIPLDRATEPAVIQNWRGEYFDNPTLGGSPVLIRDDAEINFDWGDNSPAPSYIPSDQFSVRWTRTLDLPAATYCFIMVVDDGGRLWINDTLVLDGWLVQQPGAYAARVAAPGGPTAIRMEYFENIGLAAAELQWLNADSPSLRNVRCE